MIQRHQVHRCKHGSPLPLQRLPSDSPIRQTSTPTWGGLSFQNKMEGQSQAIIKQRYNSTHTEAGGSPIETKLAFRRHAIIHINYKYTSSLPSKTASDMVELASHFVNEECSKLFVSVEPSSLVTFRSCTRSLIFCLTRREIHLAAVPSKSNNLKYPSAPILLRLF